MVGGSIGVSSFLRKLVRMPLDGKINAAHSFKTNLAYAFKSDMSLEEMRQRLNAQGLWNWRERDSYWYSYISARAEKDYVMLKIYDFDDQDFAFDIEFKSNERGAAKELANLQVKITGQVLPSISAREVELRDSVD
jgi:hypothetical protein